MYVTSPNDEHVILSSQKESFEKERSSKHFFQCSLLFVFGGVREVFGQHTPVGLLQNALCRLVYGQSMGSQSRYISKSLKGSHFSRLQMRPQMVPMILNIGGFTRVWRRLDSGPNAHPPAATGSISGANWRRRSSRGLLSWCEGLWETHWFPLIRSVIKPIIKPSFLRGGTLGGDRLTSHVCSPGMMMWWPSTSFSPERWYLARKFPFWHMSHEKYTLVV